MYLRMYLYGGILAALVAAFGLFGWRMHSRGWDAATAHYKAVVDAALAANATQAKTIAALQTANAQWADAAKANAAKVSQAVAQLEVTKADDAKALAAAQKRLQETIHVNPDAARWAATRVPADILRQFTGSQDADSHHP